MLKHRILIRNPLNMVIFTGWFLWKQAVRVNVQAEYVRIGVKIEQREKLNSHGSPMTFSQKLRRALERI